HAGSRAYLALPSACLSNGFWRHGIPPMLGTATRIGGPAAPSPGSVHSQRMKPVLFVRNDRYESFGIAAEAIAWEGLDIFTRNVAAGAPLPPVEGVAGVVMFGGTMNVDQTDRHPFLARVREYTRDAVDA